MHALRKAVAAASKRSPTFRLASGPVLPHLPDRAGEQADAGALGLGDEGQPPMSTVLNMVAGVGRMKMDDVTRGVLPFMAAEFAVMFLMVLFPWLVTVPAKALSGH